MGNKETKRTLKKMFNCCTVILFFYLHLSFALATEIKEENSLNATVTETETNSTSLQPVAEPLVRYRRQPPRTRIKHIIRPKRVRVKRVKRPKIKYSFAEPPPMYYNRKPSSSSYSGHTFDSSILEDFSHYNVESANFDLPPSSYEAQNIDIDMYKNYESPAESSYKEIHKPTSYEYGPAEVSYKEPQSSYKEIHSSYEAPEVSYQEPEKTPSYSYIPSKETSYPRKPHTKYGVPTEFVYSSGYDKPTSDNKYSYEAPAYEPPVSFKPSKPIYTEIEKPSYTQSNHEEYSYNAPSKGEYSYSIPKEAPPRIPATKYGVPDVHIPSTGTNDYNKYSVIEQKPSYASYTPIKTDKYNFAEPPQPEPNVEITYSPSYEINIPSKQENTYSSGKYNIEEHQPHAPSYEEPPQQYHPEPNYEQSPKYERPPQEYHPPPRQEYETPKYSPEPHETYENQPGYQEGSDSNQPPRYHAAPPRHASDYIPQSQDLPINVNHKQPPYNYPKSSYEVPIYDPIPFDASNNQEQEVYPPQIYDHPTRQKNLNTEFVAEPNNVSEQRPPQQRGESEEPSSGDAHSSGTRPLPQSTSQKPISPINRLRKNRKRNRKRGSSTTSTTKHILDVPELEQAFENENRNKFQNVDTDTNESHKIQNVNFNSGPWNPMKIRTSPIAVTTPGLSTEINSLRTTSKRHYYKQRSTTTSTTTTTEPPQETHNTPKVEIISIEKSQSKSYYDGILATPKQYNANFFRNRYKIENPTTAATSLPPSQKALTNENKFSKRTTKNVFDTTIFKSPLTDRDLYRNLPKNHKLF